MKPKKKKKKKKMRAKKNHKSLLIKVILSKHIYKWTKPKKPIIIITITIDPQLEKRNTYFCLINRSKIILEINFTLNKWSNLPQILKKIICRMLTQYILCTNDHPRHITWHCWILQFLREDTSIDQNHHQSSSF